MSNHRKHLLATNFGFIASPDDLKKLIEESPLQPVLVRCGGGRFVCPAQCVDHFVKIINQEKSDYVRDISVTS